MQVNGAVVITMSQLRSFLSQPAFNRTTAGLGTLTVTTVGQVQLYGSITTGCTVTTWSRIEIGAFTAITGTVTTYNGILFQNVTGPATIRAIQSVVTTGTFINHAGTAACNFGGAINLGAGATVDVMLSRGAADRLDLASGDSFRLVAGNIQFAGTAETISRSAGELLLTAATIRTSAALEVDGATLTDGAVSLRADITPTALAGAGTTNNYAPTGFATASVIRQDVGAGGHTLTGLAGGTDGLVIRLLNISTANSITLTNEDVGSTAANRFALKNSVALVIPPNGSVDLLYDSTSARWRVAADHT